MSSNFPGAFPGSFPFNNNNYDNTDHNQNAAKASNSNMFNFNSTEPSNSLYPNISHLSASTNNNSNYLSNECQKLGYSNKLSTNVLSELDQRASSKLSFTSSRGTSIRSPRTRNVSPPKRFNRLQSISSHYAAGREVIETTKDNIPEYDPHSKREMDSNISSAPKRRKMGSVSQSQDHVPSLSRSTMSTSKRTNDLSGMLKRSSVLRTDRASSRTPIKSKTIPTAIPRNTVPTSSSFRFNPRSNTTTPQVLSNNLSNITNTIHQQQTKRLSKSTTIGNLTKPTMASLSKSTSVRNLNSTTSSIPRSKTTRFEEVKTQPKPMWR